MGYKHYTPEFKTQVVLEVLREEKALGEIAAEKNLACSKTSGQKSKA